MPNLMDTLLQGLSQTDSVKDFSHASKIFVDGNFLRAPKYSFLFYVKFNFRSGSDALLTQPQRAIQMGALCKSAQLPRFTIENKTLNAYNRPNTVQTRLRYEPLSLKFHDDSNEIIREFWYDYMTYYFRDSDYQTALYKTDHKYARRQKDGWGYGLREPTNGAGYHPLESISIYSLSQKKFSEYQLINPLITSFRHGEHNHAEGAGTLENEMTVTFETVKYYKGVVSANEFGDSMLLLYDKRPSPLSAGVTNSFFGQGGLVSTLDSTLTDLANGNWGAAFIRLNKAKAAFKNTDVGNMFVQESISRATNSARYGTTYNPISAPTTNNIPRTVTATPTRIDQTSASTNNQSAVSDGTSVVVSGNQLSTTGFPSINATVDTNALSVTVRDLYAAGALTQEEAARFYYVLNNAALPQNNNTQGNPT